MSYSTIDNLLTRIDEKVLINLSNDDFPSNEINTTRVEETIQIADDIINSALRNRYSLPLQTVPPIITQISADITIYRLYSRRVQDIPQNYIKNFEQAITLLKELQLGIKTLESSPRMYIWDKTEESRKFKGGYSL
ncbi:DUF1320 domain-containing protein [bacterium]|nr:DUF1320 domain-containing protein [bacterium]